VSDEAISNYEGDCFGRKIAALAMASIKNNKKATVQKCTVAKKTQKETFNGLQAHFEKGSIFVHVWQR